MRTKLPLLMLALLPLASFGQSAKSKVSSQPLSAKSTAAAIATPTSHLPSAYCMPALDCSDDDMITNVNFGGINNTTACSPGGYGDYTAMMNTSPILAGQSYPIAVTVGTGWPYENVSVWVDYNMNDTFDASEFTYIGNANGNATGLVINGNIAIPAGTANGTYKMRVRVAADSAQPTDAAAACDETQGFGETEDYSLMVGVAAPTGCLTAPNGAYPTAAFTPTCNGAPATITTAGYAGEYSTVNVTMGTAYTFTVSKPAYFITIGDSAGATVLASGTGSVVWTATMTGVVRFYAHTDSACGSGTSATLHTRSVQCGTPPTEPDYGCDQTYTGTWSQANAVTKSLNYAVANDFFVPKEFSSYKLQTMTASFVRQSATVDTTDLQSFDVVLMSDSGSGTPGTAIKTWNGVIPTVTVGAANFAGFPTYDAVINLGDYELTGNAAADTRYWLSLQSTSASASSYFWIGYNYTTGWITAPNYQSSDNGVTYAVIASSTDPNARYDSVWSLNAECVTAAVSEAVNKNVSFYPNPVKDYLNINSKTAIETVHVYNLAGQKMQISAKVVNGKVDMSKLAPGVYIISTILEGGVNESFKVIKK